MEKAMQILTAGLLNPPDSVLLVGLGNWRATADSLGPKFIEYSPITRHYHQHAPDALVQGMRPTSGSHLEYLALPVWKLLRSSKV
jgi:spore protease